MIASLRILIAIAVQSLIATAAPVGICLHAYSPEAPAEKIECFEFEKVERAAADYRFFPRADKSVMVTAYRFRGTIPYKPGLAPTHPEFDKLLKLYEETARATPSTRPYLNPKILVMRSQAAGVAKQIEEVAKLPAITMADGTQLIGCTLSKIENGFAIIRHQDGISKVSLTELDATEKKALNSTAEGWSLEDPAAVSKDSTGTFAKIVFKNGILLKKAKFKEVADGNLVFMADGKSVSVPADQFPGELSVLGEEAVKSLAPVKKEDRPEPSVASSGSDKPPTAPVQTKRATDAFGGGFVLPGDDIPIKRGSTDDGPTSKISNGKMFQNSLAMKFVPVPIKGGETDGRSVLFCVWETRFKDFKAFVDATKYDATKEHPKLVALTRPDRQTMKNHWADCGWEITPDHPVTHVNWRDANAFCLWLTKMPLPPNLWVKSIPNRREAA